MKKIFTSITLASIVMLSGCAADEAENSSAEQEQEQIVKQVEDLYGDTLAVSSPLTKVSTNWQSETQILLMLGAEDVIDGVSPKFIKRPWVQLMYPEFVKNVRTPYDNNGDFSLEILLEQEPDLFISYTTEDTDAVKNVGITTANLGLYDYDGIEKVVLKTGEILGGTYEERAKQWQAYFNKNIELVQSRVKDIPEDEKVQVLFIRDSFESTHGNGSVISSWINLAGGVNVLDHLASTNGMVTPSAEEVLQTNPSIIIIGDSYDYNATYDTIMADERFKELAPIANNNIIFNPYGLFQWEKYSGESALQVLWAAKLFYPQLFEDVNLTEEVKYFYKTFHNFDLTDEQANYMLNAKNPDGQY